MRRVALKIYNLFHIYKKQLGEIVIKPFALLPIIISLLLTSCSWDPHGFKAQEKWLAQKKQEQIAYEQKAAAEQSERLRKAKEDKEQYEHSHPEVPIKKVDEIEGGRRSPLSHALNQLNFVTRDPQTSDTDKIYINVGSFKLTMTRFLLAVKSQMTECKRASAYADVDYKKICEPSITQELMEFADMNNDPSIPALTKQTALGEAMYGGLINFGHAARLARMHYKVCSQQQNSGYVLMDTTAVPCSGRGDVLSGYAADKLGVID